MQVDNITAFRILLTYYDADNAYKMKTFGFPQISECIPHVLKRQLKTNPETHRENINREEYN